MGGCGAGPSVLSTALAGAQPENRRHAAVKMENGGMERRLRLRPLRLGDQGDFVAAHEAMTAERTLFAHRFEPKFPWPAYVDQVRAWSRGDHLPTGFVPTTFLIAHIGGVMVGRVSIRHELNAFLETEGGHIGYCVLPEHRRRGYATEMLQHALIIARALDIDRTLLTCDEDNIGSATVIERCGGVFESTVESTRGGPPKRRYWID